MSDRRLVIIGAGGHGRVVADVAASCGYTAIGFADDRATGTVMGCPVLGTCRDLATLNDGNTDFILAIGHNDTRQRLAEQYDLPWATLVHPTASVARSATVGAGSVVMPHAVINACARIGRHCIINSSAVVEHDNVLGDCVHISPRAALGGTVTVGARTHIGIGAVVINNIDICERCVIGAGAVVVKSIAEAATYIGVPAKRMRRVEEAE